MIKSFYRIVLPFLITGFCMNACTKKPDVEYTSTYKMSGEWFVRYYVSGQAAPITAFDKILTYNTTDPSSNQIWVDDPNTWPFKSKVDVDYTNMSFKALAKTDNLSEPGQSVKVYEGKVLPNLGHSKTGNLVDSIYLKLEFTDDPGTVYEVRGHFRTGFQEDEY